MVPGPVRAGQRLDHHVVAVASPAIVADLRMVTGVVQVVVAR